ncbi:MAG: hypothetical protein QGG36_17065 [Pirellulaceae bacterium]|jgi:putative methionine-R-sulfoxide reductase with GAF domain|nr:hypothetical protein [Pirellulaceae bacterium]MDP7017516.1 hypothetical protein [Pirellulaceae bacterium]
MNSQSALNLDPIEWLHRILDQWPGGLVDSRRAEYSSLIECVECLLAGGDNVWLQLPRCISEVFADRGWAWNGFYVRHGDQLDLAPGAAGPPVCATLLLDGDGAVGRSGSCWDAMLMNQCIALQDVKKWPGYVSCDGESSLQTVSGIICPVRDATQRPIAVWDLDAEQRISADDPVLMSRLLETLSAVLQPIPDDFSRD